MKYILKRDIVWLESLLSADHAATFLLLGGDGHQVAVPAPLLLAASPLVRMILADHLPPTYSPCFLSLPFSTKDVLQDVKNILATGEAGDVHKKRIEEVGKVFEILRVKAVLISSPTKSANVGQVLDSQVENQTDEDSDRNETMLTECLEKVPPPSQTDELSISTFVNSTGFKEVNNVAVAGFKIKIEADVAHLVNDCVPKKEVVHKCSKCKYACYDKAELETHYHLKGHGRKIKYLCQNCPYTCSSKRPMNNHCKNSGHKVCKDVAMVLKQPDYIGSRVIKDNPNIKIYNGSDLKVGKPRLSGPNSSLLKKNNPRIIKLSSAVNMQVNNAMKPATYQGSKLSKVQTILRPVPKTIDNSPLDGPTVKVEPSDDMLEDPLNVDV